MFIIYSINKILGSVTVYGYTDSSKNGILHASRLAQNLGLDSDDYIIDSGHRHIWGGHRYLWNADDINLTNYRVILEPVQKLS